MQNSDDITFNQQHGRLKKECIQTSKNSCCNLFSFYREVGGCSSVSLINETGFSAVSGNNSSWPQMVYAIDFLTKPAQTLDTVLTKAVNQNLPGFAVCDAAFFGMKELEYLRQKGIYPVKTWTLMDALPITRDIQTRAKNMEIRQLISPAELHAFTALINDGFVQSVKIAASLTEELNRKKSVRIYGLFVSEELASGLLTFSDAKTTGLYFIVTKSTCRGKGFGADLIRYVLNLYRSKSEKVVLQAVQKAVPLYEKFGFTPQGKLVIFWKQ